MKIPPPNRTSVQARLHRFIGTCAVFTASLAMLGAFAGRAGVAQTSNATAPDPTILAPTKAMESGLQRHPMDIEGNQPSIHEEYLLGGGDDILVSVVGRPELSGAHVVGPDGRITLPVVGSVEVGDKSRDDAAKSVDEAVEKAYNGTSSSTVQVTKYGSNHILLLGAISAPGVITFDQPPTLLEVIAKGGPMINSDHSAQTPRKCVIYRGEDQVMNVNLAERFDSKRALNNIRLRRGDTVFIPENQESLISVLGEVGHSGPLRLDTNTTVIKLLAESGGITEKAGNNPEIQIIEPSTGKIQTVRFKELLTVNGGTDIGLHDGDIVYVPRSGLAKAGYVFQQIGPMIGLGTIFAVTH